MARVVAFLRLRPGAGGVVGAALVEAVTAGGAVVAGVVVVAAVGEANDPSSGWGAGTVPATEATIGRVVG